MNTIGAQLSKYNHLVGIQPFSAVTGDGRVELLKTVDSQIEEKALPSSKLVTAVA
ncbi:hypothetical protein D3C83_279930 [compost metagenome]